MKDIQKSTSLLRVSESFNNVLTISFGYLFNDTYQFIYSRIANGMQNKIKFR